MKKLVSQLRTGLIDQNPTFVQLLGMCPTLAVTTSLINGLGMGLAATAVLICSNVVISLLRRAIPKQIRIAGYIVIIASFVTMIDLLMQAFLPALSESLGMFIPLIVVNCIILGRAEAFASKNSVGASAMDGLSMGLGFTVALCVISTIREILGSGTILGVSLFGESFQPVMLIGMPVGGFLTLGFLIAGVQYLRKRMEKKGGEDA